MGSIEATGRRARAREITATLAGRPTGLCGYEAREAHRISSILASIEALSIGRQDPGPCRTGEEGVVVET